MSRLLPSNNSLREQNFAEFVDRSTTHDNSPLTLDPMLCHSSLLPHIALGFGTSIAGMTEKEARIYLSTIESVKSRRGTVGAVEDTLRVTFDHAELVEWFKADDLEVGEFRVAVTVKADTGVKYDERKFKLSRKLLDSAKNVRSSLADFEVKLSDAFVEIQSSNALNYKIDVSNKALINKDIEANIYLNSCVMFEFDFNKDLDITTTLDIKIKGGMTWQI